MGSSAPRTGLPGGGADHEVENTNKQRDDRYHFKRVPAYGVRSQTALIAQAEFGQIMLALADHRAAQAPPSRGRPRQNN